MKLYVPPFLYNSMCHLSMKLSRCAHIRCFCSRTKHRGTVNKETIFSDSNKVRVQEHLPTMRPLVPKESLKKDARQAAVLVPLCVIDGEPSLLFMVRSMHLNNHRGEVCFPGGLIEEGDRDMIQTALRETDEEIGLHADTVDVWGQLPLIPAKRVDGSVVTPVVGFCRNLDTSTLSLNHDEVADVFTVPIATICTPKNQRQTQWRHGYSTPVFLGGQFKIWGLTAVVLHQILTVMAPGWYIPRIKHRS